MADMRSPTAILLGVKEAHLAASSRPVRVLPTPIAPTMMTKAKSANS